MDFNLTNKDQSAFFLLFFHSASQTQWFILAVLYYIKAAGIWMKFPGVFYWHFHQM